MEYTINTSGWVRFREAMKKFARQYNPPSWGRPHFQPIPSSFHRCVWCKEPIAFFDRPTVDLGDGWAHEECVDEAERFALKSRIRHRTNPTTGYFPGWRKQ